MRFGFFGGSRGGAKRKSPASTSQKSLGLRSVLPQSEEKTLRVLDLGSAHTANLDFFSRYGGRLTVADFYASLRPVRAAAGEDGLKNDSFAEILRYDKKDRFDLILAWDLLNYLHREELMILMNGLEPFCLPGTAFLAFICTTKEMPPAPSAYFIEDEDTIRYEVREGRPRPCPRYLEQDLLKRMPGLAVENRYQLRNGMLEYVFTYRLSSRTPASSEALRYPLETLSRWSSAPSR